MEIQNSIFNYATLLKQVKARVALAQKKAIYSANEEMLFMYWDIGKLLCESQKQIGWGNNALEQLANDLKNDYPKVKGFSPRNCRCMIQFHKEYNQELTIWQPVVAKLEMSNCVLPIKQLSWSHNITLIQRVKDLKARYWYMIQCLKSGWSRNFLIEAINQDYYHTYGALANNFDSTLPEIQAKQVKETLKDPYIFDMLTFTDEYNERDVELGLVKHIEKFLLEMLCKPLHKSSNRKRCRLSRMDCSKSFSVTKARSFNPKNSNVTGVLIMSLGCSGMACRCTKADKASLFFDNPLRS